MVHTGLKSKDNKLFKTNDLTIDQILSVECKDLDTSPFTRQSLYSLLLSTVTTCDQVEEM